MNSAKSIWNKFSDILGETILHPQYFLKSYEHLAVLELKKRANGTLVDIGCGRQIYKKELIGKVNKYIGIDHPDVSKKYFDKEMPDVFADAENLPFKNNFCDTASMISVLEHLPDPGKALKEAARILKPKGILVLITVQCYPLHDSPYDFFRYTRFGLKKLLGDAGFKVKLVKPIGNYPILAGQFVNVYMLKKIKVGLAKGVFPKTISILAILPVYILCVVSNIISLLASRIVKDYEVGAFSIYNLAVAQKVRSTKS